jgi:general secretion pathway protein B
MSFILDALKKAEAERQRQTGPTLLEVRVTTPRRRFPIWIMLIAGLLAINGVLLLVFLLRRPAVESPQPAAAASVAPAAAPVVAPTAAPAPATTLPAPPALPPSATPAAVQGPVLSASAGAAAGGSGPQPGYAPVQPAADPGTDPGTGTGSDNPADYEPAVSASSSRMRAPEPRPEPPSLSELEGNMPDLRLDMNVYASRPADRYALINMHRVHEGDTLPEGPRVIAIGRDGVELSYRGTEFMLHPQ